MTEALVALGLDEADAAALATRLAAPPAGLFDADEAPGTGARAGLLALLVACSDIRRFERATRALVEELEPRLGELSTYDAGRFWHLRGFAGWRLDDSSYVATRALNLATQLLQDDGSERARHYRARVHDTMGQLLLQQGLISEARRELEEALALRAEDDVAGRGITLGNLGRLCMDQGDYRPAASYLEQDLALVEKSLRQAGLQYSPHVTLLRAQLLSHLAACRLHLGELDAADELTARSATLAREAGDVVSGLYAAVNLGRLALARKDLTGAFLVAGTIEPRLAELPERLRGEIAPIVYKLVADAYRILGEHDRAVDSYRRALRALGTPGVALIQYAEVLRGLSLTLAAKGEALASTSSLREALHYLDATAAKDLRSTVEGELKKSSFQAWLLHSAGRFVGQRHIESLLEETGHEGFLGEPRRVVVMFSDLRGFTSLSERMKPKELVRLLNEYLTQMTRCIERYGGTIDKFIGDAVMVIFPLDGDGSRQAIAAALAMREELQWFNRRLDAPLSIGIGLHGGEVIAGLIGSPQKRELTVIGDVVNTASRFEGMTKQLGASTLASDVVLAGVDTSRLLVRPLGRYAPKGRRDGIAVFDVMGTRDRSPATSVIGDEIVRVEDALAAFIARDFDTAIARFTALEHAVTDPPAGLSIDRLAAAARAPGYALLAQKAREFRATPPPAGWTGEIALLDK